MNDTVTPPQAETQSIHPLLENLMKKVKDGERGPLAELRRGAGDFPDYGPNVLRHVARFFPTRPNEREENALLLVATLFALHPAERDAPMEMNIGATLKKIASAKGNDDSVEKRLFALLAAKTPEQIAVQLRHAVALADGAGVPISWNRLLKDVRCLFSESEERRQRVVRAWSRSFWSKPASESDSDETPAS